MFHVLCCPSTSFFCKQIQGATCVFYVPLWGHLLVTALLDDGRGGISMWGVIWPWGDIHWIYAPRPGCWLATTRMIPNFLLGSYSPEKTSFPSGVLGAGVDQRYSWHKKKHTWKLTWLHSLKLTVRTAPARKLIPKRKLSSSNHQIFRCELLVSGRVNGKSPKSSKRDTSTHSWLFFFQPVMLVHVGVPSGTWKKRFPGWGVFLEFSLQKKASPMSLAIWKSLFSICHSQNDSHDRSAPSSSQEPVVPDVTSDGISAGYELVSDVGDKPNEWVLRVDSSVQLYRAGGGSCYHKSGCHHLRPKETKPKLLRTCLQITLPLQSKKEFYGLLMI